MKLNKQMLDYIDAHVEQIKQIIRDLCVIPAPSHHEEKRAEYCRAWFARSGFEGAYIDEALNVVCPYHVTQDNDLVVFMAHTDTVFPDLTPMPFREDEKKMYAPGVCDDTANLAVMMICAKYFVENGFAPKCGVLFVANSCEEGLGNLKGSRQIVKDFGARLRAFHTFDGTTLNRVVTNAVGSHRYRVTVRTEGGHSYGAFGNRNAIYYLSSIIQTIYTMKVPQKAGTKTTYNVGTITGGTSVNTIAQEASMLCEYRSDDRECLAIMQNFFEKTFEAHRAMGVEVDVELVGDRPCSGPVDPEAYAALIARADAAIRENLGQEAVHTSSSTDANIPLAAGIPAVCTSAAVGRGCHTREEEIDLDQLPNGARLTMGIIGDYFKT